MNTTVDKIIELYHNMNALAAQHALYMEALDYTSGKKCAADKIRFNLGQNSKTPDYLFRVHCAISAIIRTEELNKPFHRSLHDKINSEFEIQQAELLDSELTIVYDPIYWHMPVYNRE